ncbi:hypothetical protein VTL71DRAFT_12078 [Oculimacula yallundae]|uniref:Secreted protein n=1 Tax=Oculimacula yallundae TaxID=86028 RepID=A0ABR4CRZ5_9HELO
MRYLSFVPGTSCIHFYLFVSFRSFSYQCISAYALPFRITPIRRPCYACFQVPKKMVIAMPSNAHAHHV